LQLLLKLRFYSFRDRWQ